MANARLEVLGPVRVIGPDAVELPVRGLHAVLLAYLALQRRPILREHLTTLFWAGTDEGRAKHSLRQALSAIRASLPEVIQEGADPLSVDPEVLGTDVRIFEEHLRHHRVPEALALRRGAFLDGFRRSSSWELEDWIERKRLELDTLLSGAALEVAEAWVAAGSAAAAEAMLADVIVALPGRDDLVLARVRALAAAGRIPEAEGILAGMEPDPGDSEREDVAEVLGQARARQSSWVPEPVAPSPGRAPIPSPPLPAAREQGGEVPPTRPRARRMAPLWLAAASALVALPLLLGRVPGMPTEPAPVPPAEIWFCSPRETEHTFRMNQDGGAKTSLGVDGCPVMPVNGGSRLVAMRARDGAFGVVVVDDAGQRFFPMPFPGGHFNRPMQQAGPMDGVASPDGRWLLVTGDYPLAQGPPPVSRPPSSSAGPSSWDLYLVDLESGVLDQLTDHPARDFDARFSPDGSRVVFASERSGGGDIYLLELATRTLRQLTHHPAKEVDPSIHGDWVAFQRGSGEERPGEYEEIILLSLVDGIERRVTDNAWNDTGAEFSHDGSKLCWTSKEDGHWEADIMVLDLIRDRRWKATETPGRNDWCSWHPDADVVFFQSWRDASAEIYRTSVGPAEPGVNLTRHPAEDESAAVVVGRR
ncbi:MAG TPA: hypothetical protein VLH75_14345 [Longimicrobiales bacterium]|nr:hypothetical protein [Longimicrobiales bacterium]